MAKYAGTELGKLGVAQSRVKQLRGNNKAKFKSTWSLVMGWRGVPFGLSQAAGEWGMLHWPVCVQLTHAVLVQMYALSYEAAMQVRKHDGWKLQVLHALPFNDVVFMQMTKILAFPHCSLFRATNLILGNLLPSCTRLQYNK